MKIAVDLIKSKNPCKNRFDNFIQHYPNFEGSLVDFLALENITYSDKIWVARRILSKNQLVKWSIMCAESIRHFYENKNPNSKVLSNLFDYLNSISDFDNLTNEQINEIKTLRNAVDAIDVADAAADAAYAAAYAAYAADADDATYAAAQAATYAVDATYAAYAKEKQKNLNLLFLVSLETEESKKEL